jgi:hypothetical protein
MEQILKTAPSNFFDLSSESGLRGKLPTESSTPISLLAVPSLRTLASFVSFADYLCEDE